MRKVLQAVVWVLPAASALAVAIWSWSESPFGSPDLVAAITDTDDSLALRYAVARFPRSQQAATSRNGKLTTALYYEFDYDTLYTRLDEDLKQDKGIYDVVIVDNPWMPRFSDRLDTWRKSEVKDFGKFIPNAWENARMGGDRLAGVPYVGNVQLLCFNEGILGQTAPDTWNGLIASSKRVRAGRYAFGIRAGGDDSDVVDDFMPILFSTNGDVQSALDTASRLASVSPPSDFSLSSFEISSLLLKSRIGAGLCWSRWAMAIDRAANGSSARVRVNQVPGAKPESGVWFLAVPKNAPHRKAGRRFVEWATSRAQMFYAAKNYDNPPTRSDLGLDPLAFPTVSTQLEALNKAVSRPRCEDWKKAEDTAGEAIRRVYLGELKVAEGAKEVEAALSCETRTADKGQ
jgi:multiple sugar transport system substrate-binding protein